MSQPKNETQLFRLFQLLSTGDTVLKTTIVAKLGVKESSVPVYIHSLKKKFGAVIENATEGRVVMGYILRNNPEVPQFKRATHSAYKRAASPAPVVTTDEIPVLDTDIDTEISDREFADVVLATGYTPGDY